MYYYKKNLGDYAKKAGRLNMLQHGAYTLIIDACYDRERFPTLEEAIDWAWASSKEEIEAVTFVLLKFFDLEDDVYIQNRIKQELANFHKNSATNKRIAIEREAKRKGKSTKRVPTVNESPPNQEPVTNNQYKKTKAKKTALAMLVDMNVDENIADEWLQVRKLKKLSATQTAFNAVAKQANKVDLEMNEVIKLCVENSWGGFKAYWLTGVGNEKNKHNAGSDLTGAGKRKADVLDRIERLDQL